ncbi:MAG: AtzH-like domain-containing protein [Pseudomonadota bacterium]
MAAFDEAAVAAEIRAEFDAYEAALTSNDVAALAGFFWEDPRVVRLGSDGGLYGHDQIVGFRKGRDVSDIARDLSEIRILVLGPDLGVATCEYRRLGSGRRGAQSQVWRRRPEGWRIVSAHVTLMP